MATDKKKSPAKFIGAGIGAAVVIVALFLPIVQISAQEAYTENETKQEAYTVTETKREAYVAMEEKREPYQVLDSRTETIVSGQDQTLQGGYYTNWPAYVDSGRRIEFSVRASDTVDTYILTSSEFEQFKEGSSFNSVAERKNTDNTRYGITAPISDTYYFIVQNKHDGFFGVGDKSVGIFSVTATVSWEEYVTKYRTVDAPVTKYRNVDVPVTKYKDVQVPVTKYKDVSKTISLIEYVQRK